MAKTPSDSKSSRLRALLESPGLEFLMEAHNGVSARIVEEAGFKGIWASGLAISAQFGVRDNNEVSWSQLVDMLEFMADSTTIPILVDGDTGHGNFNNLRRFVQKLEQRGIAGVCIEDKLFPKTNSFINSERQPLADVDEFCGKIQAGKDTQRDPDFCVIARVEALIAGWGVDEALRRADAYREAGADAILIHSKHSRPDEILAFASEWENRCPLVVVPTTYYSTPPEVLERAGISLAIWANHMLRTSIASMQTIAREVFRQSSVAAAEDHIAPIKEIFRLQGAEELAAAEERYLGRNRAPSRAVVLAASRGRGLEKLTEDRPKVMVPIAGRPLLRRLTDAFKAQAIHDVTVVAGYKSRSIDVPGVRLVENDDYETTGELASLMCAIDSIRDDSLILYGDLLFRNYVLRDLLDATGEIVVVVDSSAPVAGEGGSRDYAWCSTPDDRSLFGEDVELLRVSDDVHAGEGPPAGRWIGMFRVTGAGAEQLRAALMRLSASPGFAELDLPHLLNYLVDEGCPVRVLYIHGHWLDVNSVEDLDRAARFARPRSHRLGAES